MTLSPNLRLRCITLAWLSLALSIAWLLRPIGLYGGVLVLCVGSIRELMRPLVKLLVPTWGLCAGLLAIAAALSPLIALLLVFSIVVCLRLYHAPYNDPLSSPVLLTTIFSALLSFIVLATFQALSAIANQNFGPSLFAISVAISVDTLGYLIGQFFTPKPLGLKISPKKTLLGYFGSIILTFFLFTQGGVVSWKTNSVVMGLIIFSIIGDLGFSLPKRLAHMKDYSHSLPGHGGLLDRLDSVFTVLFFINILDSFPQLSLGFV